MMVNDVNMGETYLLTIPLSQYYPTTAFTYIKIDFFPSFTQVTHAYLSTSYRFYIGAATSVGRTPTYGNT